MNNFTAVITSPNSVVISWYPPAANLWNGIIIRYTVAYTQRGSVDEDSELTELRLFAQSIPLLGFPLANSPDPRTANPSLVKESMQLMNLQEYLVYEFMVFFENSAGESESSEPINLEMPQIGNLLLINMQTCF